MSTYYVCAGHGMKCLIHMISFIPEKNSAKIFLMRKLRLRKEK